MTCQRQFEKYEPYLTFLEDRLDFTVGLLFVADFLDVDALPTNGVSLNSADIADIKLCREFFASFPCVVVAVADDEERRRICDAFSTYLPAVRVYETRTGAFGSCANVREVLSAGGGDALSRLIQGCSERPARGLIDLADVKIDECRKCVLSGIRTLDSSIGGFAFGEVNIWTGKRGSGKSTIVSQLALESIEQGYPVCVYSGELKSSRFKEWFSLQAAGADHAEQRTDKKSGVRYYAVDAATEAQLNEWIRGRLFLYDHDKGSGGVDHILSLFEMASIRFGCKTFVFDNVMSARNDVPDKDVYRAQSEMVGRLVAFSKKHDAVVHIVAHPKKTDRQSQLDADDISGSGDISNRADNVFALHRLSDEEREKHGYDCALKVLKNRAFGFNGYIALDYDAKARRFFKTGTSPSRRYGWQPTQTFMELPDERTPLD